MAQAQAIYDLKKQQLDALKVRAGISGVLTDLPLAVGQHVTIGTMLAQVVQPNQLKAQLKIAETQARDILIGQPASIDTHNGLADGKVSRIDPAVQNGTVTVDVELIGALPSGARDQLSVDGTIDLERLSDVLYVGRPAFGNENSTISLFKSGSGWQRGGPRSGQSRPRLCECHPGAGRTARRGYGDSERHVEVRHDGPDSSGIRSSIN